MKTKADLHVHSRFSNKPSYWALRKFRCPESFTAPDFIYRSCKKAGMDFVTITDHNCIDGALEIAHLPDAFVSAELTAYFPEDGCKVHVVALDIDEPTFADLNQARKNIYDLSGYLNKNGVAHFLAHPLYIQNDRLSVAHFEKLLLLFNHFEAINGNRARRFNRFTADLLYALDASRVADLADKHGIEPIGNTPWAKAFCAGSDDHSGLFIGRAFTETSAFCGSKDAFIDAVRKGETTAQGEHGDPLTLAHSLYGIGYGFYRSKSGKEASRPDTPFLNLLLDSYFDPARKPLGLSEKIKLFVRQKTPELLRAGEKQAFERLLDREAMQLIANREFLATLDGTSRNRKIFEISSYLANRMLYHYTLKLARMPLQNGFLSLMNDLSSVALVHLLVSPYYMAFNHMHRDKGLMGELEQAFHLGTRQRGKEKIALFTDTLDDINGVAITIRRLVRAARERGIDLTVITSDAGEPGCRDGVMHFQSIGQISLPEYPELKLNFPPILNVLDYIEREDFTRIHVSTPGTIGSLGLLIAKLFRLPVDGTYHTDIPHYVRDLTDDDFLEKAAWNFMIWFYSQMDEVMVPSASTREQLIAHGLPREKTRPLPRWVDSEHFHPEKRDLSVLHDIGLATDRYTFLYIGRVSKEKNLELLADAFARVARTRNDCQLVIVGDGPYRTEMEQRLSGLPAAFTGFRDMEELPRIYASCDLFLFPSTTDTFGNVVLEAQASGLPVIVTDQGGPRELMVAGETGHVVPGDDRDALVTAMTSALDNPEATRSMGWAARNFILEGSRTNGPAYSTILRQDKDRAANF